MFGLSTRFGAMADRLGPRLFMGVGPLITALGLALFLRVDADVDYLTDLLPALLVFALGLSMTVAPLTATVLADADEHNAGVASGVNNAIARVAGLVAIAGVGAIVASSYGSSFESKLGALADRPALSQAVEDAKRQPLAPVPAGVVPPRCGRGWRRQPRRRRWRRSTWAWGSPRRWWAWPACSASPGSRTRGAGSRPSTVREASWWACRKRARAARPATGAATPGPTRPRLEPQNAGAAAASARSRLKYVSIRASFPSRPRVT